MKIQAITVTSKQYTPASADLPKVPDYSNKSTCPFLPQPEPEPTSHEWKKFVHPKGTVYWYNSYQTTVLANHAYDLTDEDQRLRLETAIDALWRAVRSNTNPTVSFASATATTSVDPDVRADYELFIDIDHMSRDSPVRYYFVDWSCRSIFWLEPMSLFNAISKEHLAAKLTTQFWKHVAAYPMHHTPPSGSSEELRSVIVYSQIDSIQSSSSIVPWTKKDTQLLMSSLEKGSEYSMDSKPHYLAEAMGILNAATAGLWCDICPLRFANPNSMVPINWLMTGEHRASTFYGDGRAMVTRVQHHYRGREPSAMARTMCSLIFFNRPRLLEADLKALFFEGKLYHAQWRAYMEKEIEPEWQGTQAAIMLAANMAFLALDSVQKANDSPFLACKTLCLSSTTLSVGAIFATLKLSSTHQKWKSATLQEASDYMRYCSNRMLGLFGLAVVYSIPFAMFMWSLFTFAAAVLLYAFQHWTRAAGLPLIATAVAPIVTILALEWWFFEGKVYMPREPSTFSIVVSPEPAMEPPEPTPSSGPHISLRLLSLSNLRGRSRLDDAENHTGSQ